MKKQHIAKAASSIEVAATKKIELIARAHKGTISMAQGIPSFFTAPHIKEAAIKAIKDGLVDKYTNGYGILELREAIAEKIKRDNGFSVLPEEIIVTHGGIEALMAVFLALVDHDEEIIVLTPAYASHVVQIKIVSSGRGPVCVPLDETKDGWKLNVEKLKKAVNKKTRAILFSNPCNPTGKVFERDELKEIAKIALKHNLYIISDEMYEYFLYGGKKHVSIASFKEVKKQIITIFGLSKSYAMTGWRIGYIAANKNLIDQIFKVHDSLVTCASAPAQYAALAAITGPQNIVEKYRNAFDKRRDMVIKALSKTDKMTLIPPDGAYYALPKFVNRVDDNKFALECIKEGKVAVIPGTPFGKGAENHIRISFGNTEEILAQGLERFVKYVNRKL